MHSQSTKSLEYMSFYLGLTVFIMGYSVYASTAMSINQLPIISYLKLGSRIYAKEGNMLLLWQLQPTNNPNNNYQITYINV